MNTAAACSKSLLQVINEILDFSKLEAGRLKVEHIEYNLLQEIDEVVRIFKNQARSKGLLFQLYICPDVPALVKGDPGRTRQILLNLLSNAFKFTDSGYVAIHVSYLNPSSDSHKIQIEILDSGIGVSDKQRDQLFQSFSQGDTSTTRKYGGTGLGLSISRELCKLMGGHIGQKPNKNSGSIFWFNFSVGLSGNQNPPYGEVQLKAQRKKIAIIGNADSITSLMDIFGIKYSHFRSSAEIEQFLSQSRQSTPDYDFVLFEPESIEASLLVDYQPANFSLSYESGPVYIAYGKILKFERAGYLCHQRILDPIYPTFILELLGKKEGYIQSPCSARGVFRSKSTSNIAETIDYSGFRVLLVEDNLVNQKVACSFLKKLKIVPEIAVNGREAVTKTLAAHYDLILMDCMMPQLDGYQATREIRNNDRNPCHLSPIVAMTANALAGDRDKCMQAGMNDYLPKPIHFDDMKSMVKKWLNPDPSEICSLEESIVQNEISVPTHPICHLT